MGIQPQTTADADFDPSDRCRSGPCDTTNRHLARLDFCVRLRLGDYAPYSLQRQRLSHDSPVALPLKKVSPGLVMPPKRLADDIDLGKPFHRRHRIPTGNDKPQRVTMLNWERLSIHGIGEQRLRPASVFHA